MNTTAIIDFTTYGGAITEALDRIDANTVLAEQTSILIKPNLVTASPYPITTSVQCCAAIIDYARVCNADADIVIGEGTGDPAYDGLKIFSELGYTRLAEQKQVHLIDLNAEPVVKCEKPECKRFPEFYLPEIAMSRYIISVPVLKAHTLAGFTGTMKNMMGFAPPAHYAGSGGIWNKAAFHSGIQEAIRDLNRYRSADLSVMDAVVGMPDSHLGGRRCDPPVGKILAGFAPLAVDRKGAQLLGIDWRKIGHLQGAL